MGHFIAKKDFYQIKKGDKFYAKYRGDQYCSAKIYPVPELTQEYVIVQCNQHNDIFEWVPEQPEKLLENIEKFKKELISPLEIRLNSIYIVVAALDECAYKNSLVNEIEFIKDLIKNIEQKEFYI